MTFLTEQYIKPIYRTDAQITLATLKGLCVAVGVLGVASVVLTYMLVR